MQTLVHADIFFFVTTIFVVVLTIGSAVALTIIILILRDLKYVSELVRREGEKIAGDLEDVRDAIKGEGMRFKSILDFFLTLFMKRAHGRKKKSDSHE